MCVGMGCVVGALIQCGRAKREPEWSVKEALQK